VSILAYDFVVRGLVAALFTGLAAPAVGTYLVQRRLALMGDGIGHIAVTGVALGLLTGTSPILTAVIVAALGAILIEVIREKGRASGDVALAMLFYGGIAGGVLITGLAGQSAAKLNMYLFGSLLSISSTDVWLTVALAAVLVVVAVGLSPQLFAVAQDQEFAKVSGLNVRFYNVLVAVMAAVTVTEIRIHADFGNADSAGNVRLNLRGTEEDLRRMKLELREGLEVLLSDGELSTRGRVHFSTEEGIWVAAVSWPNLLEDGLGDDGASGT
jgi:ABC-type Mn2+/Zn2+ transport system permease subunit